MLSRKEIGAFGEKIAKRYLEKRGYKILAQNFRKKFGELDIVTKKNKNVIFFEVKTREVNDPNELESFLPEDEISFEKEKQLRKMTQIYLAENNLSLNTSCQIDILAINLFLDSQRAKIRHYKNAIEDKY